MRISEMLQAIAGWLESADNEAVMLAEYDDQCLKVVAEGCVEAAGILKKVAEEVNLIEPTNGEEPNHEKIDELTDQLFDATKIGNWYQAGKLLGEIDKLLGNTKMDAVEAIRVLPYFSKKYNLPRVPLSKWVHFGSGYCDAWNLSDEEQQKEIDLIFEFVDRISSRSGEKQASLTGLDVSKLSALAEAFDRSGDEELIKQASVIDELLLTIAANSDEFDKKKANTEKKIDELQRKYHEIKNKLDDKNKVAETKKAIEDSGYTKEFKILEAPMKSRYCPDHSGVSLLRVDDDIYQCSLDHKMYNFRAGYQLENGSKVPGGSVEGQTDMLDNNMYTNFDTRDSRLRS